MHVWKINHWVPAEGLLSQGGLDVSLALLPQLPWSFAAHCKVTRGGEERGSLWLGRGTLRTNWDPDVMADSINPCWLAEERSSVFAEVDFLGFFFPQGGGRREDDGRGDGFWRAGGCAWAGVAQL